MDITAKITQKQGFCSESTRQAKHTAKKHYDFRARRLLHVVDDINALTGNDLEADCILLRMNERKVTNVDRNTEGVLVTFADGYTFLFQSDFLYMVRLKHGQLVGQEKLDK
jgi:hypothetical protein